jgi:hypothetical protein
MPGPLIFFEAKGEQLIFLASNQSQQKSQDHGAENRDDNGVDHPALTGKAKRAHNETADDSAHNADDDVHQRAITAAFHELACQPASNQANNNPPENKHAETPFQ